MQAKIAKFNAQCLPNAYSPMIAQAKLQQANAALDAWQQAFTADSTGAAAGSPAAAAAALRKARDDAAAAQTQLQTATARANGLEFALAEKNLENVQLRRSLHTARQAADPSIVQVRITRRSALKPNIGRAIVQQRGVVTPMTPIRICDAMRSAPLVRRLLLDLLVTLCFWRPRYTTYYSSTGQSCLEMHRRCPIAGAAAAAGHGGDAGVRMAAATHHTSNLHGAWPHVSQSLLNRNPSGAAAAAGPGGEPGV